MAVAGKSGYQNMRNGLWLQRQEILEEAGN